MAKSTLCTQTYAYMLRHGDFVLMTMTTTTTMMTCTTDYFTPCCVYCDGRPWSGLYMMKL